MDENKRLQDYEESANDHTRWTRAANDLLIAANILEKNYKKAQAIMQNGGSGKVPPAAEVLAPMSYLKAKALELLLKALYIKQGNKVTEDGVFTYGSHDLVKLAQNVRLPADDISKKLLVRLTDCITYWGTYPIPLNVKKWRPQTDFVQGYQPLYYWGETDDIQFSRLLDEVWKSLI